jgi:chitodextrinase
MNTAIDDIAIETQGIVVAPDTQAPTTPLNVKASNIATTSFNINWTASTDNIGVKEYEIFVNNISFGKTPNTNFNITNRTASTTYNVTVKAIDTAGNVSAASTALAVKTLSALDTQAPTKPLNLKASNITTSTFTLSWTAATDNVAVTKYLIYQNSQLIGEVAGNITTRNIIGLKANSAYNMVIRAVDAAGNKSLTSTALYVKTLSAQARIANAAIIAPNPVQNTASVTFINEKNSPATIVLSDFNGKIYFTQKIDSAEGENFYQLDVTDVPNGLYLLQILRAERYETLKVQVVH